jgi:hypothetical protein
MRTVKTETGVEIEFYSSAKDCSIERYIQLQKYLVIENGIGSSVDAINNRYLRLDAFIRNDDKEAALLENENALYAVNSALQGVSYLTIAFACIVARIGGKPCEDLTDDGLQATAQLVRNSGLTYRDLELAVEDVKKKISDEIDILFPSLSDATGKLIYYSRVKNYVLMVTEIYQKEEPTEEDINMLEKEQRWFITNDGAKNFKGDDVNNVASEIERNFYSLCSVMEQNHSINPRQYTVAQFYGKIDYLNKQAQPQDGE